MRKKCEKHVNWESLKRVEVTQERMKEDIARGNCLLRAFVVRERMREREKREKLNVREESEKEEKKMEREEPVAMTS